METRKKISISALEVEIPALETNAEGHLKGGFSAVSAKSEDKGTNGNCHGCGGVPLLNSACYTNGNCDNCMCTYAPTTTTTTTTTGSASSIPNFDMNFSMLF